MESENNVYTGTIEPPKQAAGPVPSIGRIVHYRLSKQDVDAINARRVDRLAYGNPIAYGDAFPMLIVAAWGQTPESAVNGRVLLDGTDDLWVTSRLCGEEEGTWSWPPRS